MELSTATPTEVHEIPLAELGSERNLEILRALFHEPEKLKPGVTSQAITGEAAEHIGDIAQALRDRGLPPGDVASLAERIVSLSRDRDLQNHFG